MVLPNESTVFVLVPGSFSPASFYHQVSKLLKEKGFDVYETELMSVNDGNGDPVSMMEDAKHIHTVIAGLSDEGKSVIMGMNSYGGLPGTQAAYGLSRSEREALGKPGGLVHMVYMASFMPPPGSNINEIMVGRMPEATTAPTPYLTLDPKKDAEYIFSHLDASQKAIYAGQIKRHSSRTFNDRLEQAGYMHVPSTYLICTDDLVIPPELQHHMVDEAVARGAHVEKEILNSDHCPMISHPEEVSKVLLKVAGQDDSL